jgi:hypothetical protein
VKFSDVLDQLPTDRTVRRVYGEIRAGRRPRRFDSDAQDALDAGAAFGFAAVPVGVALIGVLTGLLAAVIGSLAVLRQPPWPRITITGYK